jgi:hypothetical protein
VDNDGDALVTGALYYNSTTDVMRVYDGAAWIDAGSGLTFAEISATPTTLAGYGITDAVASSTITVYGASLIDDADAATARTTLGLGTAATTAASAYATAAQGTLADSALQSDSTLNADNMTTGTLSGGTY